MVKGIVCEKCGAVAVYSYDGDSFGLLTDPSSVCLTAPRADPEDIWVCPDFDASQPRELPA